MPLITQKPAAIAIAPRSFAVAAILGISLTAALPGMCEAASRRGPTIRVVNSGAGGDPGYFYVGGPLNVTVKGPAPAATFTLCIRPAPIDRGPCRHGRVGRTIDSIVPSKAGLTKLRVDFGEHRIYVRMIRVRAR